MPLNIAFLEEVGETIIVIIINLNSEMKLVHHITVDTVY